ncbi:hypothetical protein AB205_0110710, partial [Aquarana catesbeiana]
ERCVNLTHRYTDLGKEPPAEALYHVISRVQSRPIMMSIERAVVRHFLTHVSQTRGGSVLIVYQRSPPSDDHTGPPGIATRTTREGGNMWMARYVPHGHPHVLNVPSQCPICANQCPQMGTDWHHYIEVMPSNATHRGISATNQCHQCHQSVSISATCQCPSVPISAHLSVPISAHPCHLSVPPISTYQ